jgi:hypothetical protein
LISISLHIMHPPKHMNVVTLRESRILEHLFHLLPNIYGLTSIMCNLTNNTHMLELWFLYTGARLPSVTVTYLLEKKEHFTSKGGQKIMNVAGRYVWCSPSGLQIFEAFSIESIQMAPHHVCHSIFVLLLKTHVLMLLWWQTNYRTGQAVTALLRRLRLKFQGHESSGEIHITVLAIRKWLQPNSTPQSFNAAFVHSEVNSSPYHQLVKNLSDQQRAIRMGGVSSPLEFAELDHIGGTGEEYNFKHSQSRRPKGPSEVRRRPPTLQWKEVGDH